MYKQPNIMIAQFGIGTGLCPTQPCVVGAVCNFEPHTGCFVGTSDEYAMARSTYHLVNKYSTSPLKILQNLVMRAEHTDCEYLFLHRLSVASWWIRPLITVIESLPSVFAVGVAGPEHRLHIGGELLPATHYEHFPHLASGVLLRVSALANKDNFNRYVCSYERELCFPILCAALARDSELESAVVQFQDSPYVSEVIPTKRNGNLEILRMASGLRSAPPPIVYHLRKG